MRVAIYARVSTNRQDTDVQLGELREYVRRRNWVLVEEYVDEAVSGARVRRTGLNKLNAAARKRKIDLVLVWKFDRFARSLKHLIDALEEFRALGIEFISYQDQIDTTTPQGRFMFQIIGAVAEFERAIISERVKAGLRNAVRKGKKLGRRKARIDLERALELQKEGLSIRQIAAELNCHFATLHRHLTNAEQP